MAIFAKAERGHAREEYYTVSKTEEFGLNERTRRAARGAGDERLTTPDGKIFVCSGESTGKR